MTVPQQFCFTFVKFRTRQSTGNYAKIESKTKINATAWQTALPPRGRAAGRRAGRGLTPINAAPARRLHSLDRA